MAEIFTSLHTQEQRSSPPTAAAVWVPMSKTFIWKEDTLQTDMQIKAISKEMQQTHLGAHTHCALSKFSILLTQPSLEVPLAQQVMFDSVVMR